MGFDLMSHFRNAWSWMGGGQTKGGTKVDGHASVGADTVKTTTTANDILGGMVGGFGTPMDWKGAGFGATAGGKITDKKGAYTGADIGIGGGAGYSVWSGKEGDYSVNGASTGAGVVAPLGYTEGNKYYDAKASTNVYSGTGGSFYDYDNGKGDRGYGAKGSTVPIGLADTNVGLKTDYFDANAHVDNAYWGKVGGDAKFGSKDGTYYGDVSGYQKMGVEGVKGSIDTKYGSASGKVGQVSYGTDIGGGGSYNSKTGEAELHGKYSDGITAKDIGVGYKTADGKYENLSVGGVHFGNTGQGDMKWDPKTGTFTANGSARVGGLQVTDSEYNGGLDGVYKTQAKLGEFSTDTKIDDVKVIADKEHVYGQASVDYGGVRFSNLDANAQFGSGKYQVNADAHAGSFGSSNSVTKGYADINWGGKDPHVKAGFDEVSIGGWSGKDFSANVKGPYGVEGNAKLGEFTTGFSGKGGDVTIDKNGVAANLDSAYYTSLAFKDASYDVKLGGAYSANAKLGEVATNRVSVNGAEAGLTFDKGLYAGAKDARYDSVYIQGLDAKQSVGGDLYQSHLGLGEGAYNSFSGKNLSASVDTSGAKAHLEDGKYRYLAGKDIDAKIDMFGKNLGVGVGAKEASFGGVDIGKADYNMDFKTGVSSLDVQNLGAHGWKSKDIHADANIYKVGANVGAKELNLLDLNVGEFKTNQKYGGLQGDATVKDANLDITNIKGGHAGLSWDGKEFLGGTGDYSQTAKVESAKANWDVLSGTADAKFKNASYGQQLSNAKVNLFGNDIALPDAGFKVNASGGGNVDLRTGSANANLSLGGSSANFAGHTVTVPDWVQAQGGVNMSQGAANVQVGGRNGVGANMNLSQGNLDVNAFGYTVDVDQGVRDAGHAISNTASRVYNALPSVHMPKLSW